MAKKLSKSEKESILADAIRKMWDDLKYACEDAGDLGTASSNLNTYLHEFTRTVCSGIDAPYGYTHTMHYRLWQDVIPETPLAEREPIVRLDMILTEVATDKKLVFKFSAPLGGFPLYQ